MQHELASGLAQPSTKCDVCMNTAATTIPSIAQQYVDMPPLRGAMQLLQEANNVFVTGDKAYTIWTADAWHRLLCELLQYVPEEAFDVFMIHFVREGSYDVGCCVMDVL